MSTESEALFRLVDGLLPQAQAFLEELCKIPSVSFPNYDPAEVLRSAEAVATVFKQAGFPSVHVVRSDKYAPAVIAAWGQDPKQTTILLYAHHDVQPEMNQSKWISPPFEPTVRDGRLYARGAADDKAGILVHATAAQALHQWAQINDTPCPNLRILIEGEEEVGSAGLAHLLAEHREFLQADTAIVADLGNFATGVPAVTASLRGMVALEVEVRSLKHSLHSGLWSGPIPDVVQGLCKMIAGLTDAEGNMLTPHLLDPVIPPDQATRDSYASLQIKESDFRRDADLLPSVHLRCSEQDIPESIWRRPSLTVTTLEAGNRRAAGNVLLDSAYARVSIRLVPGMKWQTVVTQVSEHLRTLCPWGLDLHITSDEGANAWSTPTDHPFFQRMLQALDRGFGKTPRIIGCGASIPGAPLFTEAFGDIPILLTGLEDHQSNAHGENESLDLDDFRKAILSEAEFMRQMRNNAKE